MLRLSSFRPLLRPVNRFMSSAASSAARSAGSVDPESRTVIYGLEGEEVSADMDEFGRTYGTGKRKTSIARVWIKEGSGQFLVNGRRITDYFTQIPREYALSPLVASNTAGFFDVWCTVKGGGTSGQSGAVRLGLARALDAWDGELRPLLRTERCLTRDARIVERKKPGQKKARKKYQWVKR